MKRLLCVVLLAGSALAVTAPASAQGWNLGKRDPLPVPDLPGYRTLKADFHLHTVFSDGRVWPDVHVFEAWRDGLDVIALTDHVDYHPLADDVRVDGTRPYAIARPVADRLGILLVPGGEITHDEAHFNALFIRNPDDLKASDPLEALRRARDQNAFVFWNHPGRRPGPLEWPSLIETAVAEGLIQGIEIVNADEFFPEAFAWVADKRLTAFANSDVHEPTPPRALAGIRPITLLFVRSADLDGVREALESRRTVAWMGGRLWGAEEHVRGLWEGAIAVRRAGSYLLVDNRSAIPFHVRVVDEPATVELYPTTIEPEGTTLIHMWAAAPGAEREAPSYVEIEITNLHVGPDENLRVRIALNP